MHVKKMSCVLKPRVSYNKIPKKCFKICNSITRRHRNHKKRNKQISFNLEPPEHPNTLSSNFELPDKNNTPEPSNPPESTTSTESDNSPESTTSTESDTSPESSTTETNNEEPTTETSIINRITNSASSLLGFSNKKGGKSAKKRKHNTKRKCSKKRKNKLKR